MVTKGNSHSTGEDQQQGYVYRFAILDRPHAEADVESRSKRAVAGTGDQFKQRGAATGKDGKESSEQIPRSIDNQRAPYSDPTGSSSLLLLESKVRRAKSQIPEGQDAPKRPITLQRWLSQNSDFPEYWHSHGGSEQRSEGRSVEDLERADEERQRRHKELSDYSRGADT